MKTLYTALQPFKFRLTIFALLCGATMASLVLFRVRTILSGALDYGFLVGNIFLAWIPLGIAYTASVVTQRRRLLFVIIPLAAFLWLIFFPNAPYILTDLQHLAHPRAEIPLWFDILLLIWFAWTGLLLGMVSLFLMQRIILAEFGRVAGWLFVLAAGLLTSVGIYVGRFLRWNSWDLLVRPLERLSEFMYYAMHPSLQSEVFIGTFAGFFLFVYVSIYSFGLLIHEQTPS